METVTIKVSGMTCGGCVNSVRKAVSALPGVSTVDVSLDSAQAKVVYDAARARPAEIKAAITDAGFNAD